MMLVMLSSEKKLGERKEEEKQLRKETVSRQPLPPSLSYEGQTNTQQRSLADWYDKMISCLLVCVLVQFH